MPFQRHVMYDTKRFPGNAPRLVHNLGPMDQRRPSSAPPSSGAQVIPMPSAPTSIRESGRYLRRPSYPELATVSETRAERSLSLLPTSDEAASLASVLTANQARLTLERSEAVLRHFRCGAYSTAATIVDEARTRNPDDRGFYDLARTVRARATSALLRALGGLFVVVEPNAGVTPFHQANARVLALATGGVTIAALMRSMGGDAVEALETIGKLVQQRWLYASSERRPTTQALP